MKKIGFYAISSNPAETTDRMVNAACSIMDRAECVIWTSVIPAQDVPTGIKVVIVNLNTKMFWPIIKKQARIIDISGIDALVVPSENGDYGELAHMATNKVKITSHLSKDLGLEAGKKSKSKKGASEENTVEAVEQTAEETTQEEVPVNE